MGTPELHLSPAAAPRKRLVAVAGESMRPFLSPGDALELDLDPARRAKAGPGDIVVFLDADARLTAHRVLARWRGTLMTKGDARLLPDLPLPAAAVVAVAAAVISRGRRRALGGRAAGLGAAGGGLLLVACRRLSQLAAWPARAGCLAVWSAAEAAGRVLLWNSSPAAARALSTALSWAETAPEAMSESLGEAMRHFWKRPDEPASAQAAGPRWAGGMLTGDETWSGEVQLFGDVVVPAGVTLTVLAGTRVAAKGSKRWHHGASRRAQGASREADPDRPRLAVYGRLVLAGREDSSVSLTGEWEGITLYGGRLEAQGARLEGAVRGVSAQDGAQAGLKDCIFMDCAVALEVCGGSRADGRGVRVEGGALALGVGDGSRARWHGGSVRGVETAFRVRGAGRLFLTDASAEARDFALNVEDRGAVHARRSRLEGSQSGVVAQASRLRLDRVRVRGGVEGVVARGGARLDLRSCRLSAQAAALSVEDGRASASSCSLNGGRFGALVDGVSSLRLTRCVLRGAQAAAQAEKSADLSASRCLLSHGGSGLVVLGRARAALKDCRLVGNAAHGVWAQGEGSVVLENTATARSGADGILSSHAASISTRSGTSREDAVGLAADGGRLFAASWKVACPIRAGAVLSAGTHVLEDCAFSGGPTGLEASGCAAAKLTRATFADISGPAVALAGAAVAVLIDSRMERCGAGLELAEDAGLEGSGLVVEGVTGHGLCLQDRASLEARSVILSRCGENGVYLQDRASIDLSDGNISNCAGGLAADGGASILRRVELRGSRRAGALLAAGEHVLERCSFTGGPTGLEASGSATAKLTNASFANTSGPAVSLAGKAGAVLTGACVEGCGAGIELAEDARLAGSGLVVEGVAGHGLCLLDRSRLNARDVNLSQCGENGVYIDGQTVLEFEDGLVSDCASGLAADGGTSLLRRVELRSSRKAGALLSAGAHTLEDCSFMGGPAGLEASGSSMTQLTRASFADAAGPAVALAGKAAAMLSEARVERCGTGLSVAEDARLDGAGLVIKDMSGHGVCLRDRARLSARGADLSRCAANGVYLQDQAEVELTDGRISDCAGGFSADGGTARLHGMRLSGARKLNADFSAGHHFFEDCTLERAPRGLSVRAHAQVELTRVCLSGHELAACAAGKSKLTATSCRWTGNKTGLWAQENGAAELTACRFAAHAEPALRLGQNARAKLSGCLFHGDWMAVFAEDDSSLEADRTFFRRTPTGVKLGGRSRARLSNSRFSGCTLDGLWVDAAAQAKAERCVFARCRVGLHAHVAAKLEWPASTFRLNAGEDRRTFGEVDSLS